MPDKQGPPITGPGVAKEITNGKRLIGVSVYGQVIRAVTTTETANAATLTIRPVAVAACGLIAVGQSWAATGRNGAACSARLGLVYRPGPAGGQHWMALRPWTQS